MNEWAAATVAVSIRVVSVTAAVSAIGEEIAKVGMTGYTYLPHLHFQVFVITGINMWTDFDTVKVRF
jgi:hypothetical protein